MDQKVLIILDNHKIHITVDEFGEEIRISHKLQPFDGGVFGRLKNIISLVVRGY